MAHLVLAELCVRARVCTHIGGINRSTSGEKSKQRPDLYNQHRINEVFKITYPEASQPF